MRRKFQDGGHDVHGVRARALEAAGEILQTQGLDKLNLRMIADRAEIGLTSIYYYFASKEDLLLSLALSGFDEVRKNIAEAVASHQDENSFRAGCRAYLSYSQRRPALYALMYDEQLMSRHETLREAEERTFAEFREIVRQDSRFPSNKADGIAFALWALGRGISAIALSQEGGAVTPEQLALFSTGANYLISRT